MVLYLSFWFLFFKIIFTFLRYSSVTLKLELFQVHLSREKRKFEIIKALKYLLINVSFYYNPYSLFDFFFFFLNTFCLQFSKISFNWKKLKFNFSLMLFLKFICCSATAFNRFTYKIVAKNKKNCHCWQMGKGFSKILSYLF